MILFFCRCNEVQVVPATGPAKHLTLALGNNVELKLVLIPAGKFLMGSPKSEKGHRDIEGPQHEVTISRPFYMGMCEVTQEQYRQIMGTDPSPFKGPSMPVQHVKWYEAVEFCKKLSRATGKRITLPTEAQWEYACRAGSKTRFSFGDDDSKLPDYAWVSEHIEDSMDSMHRVGQKLPNPWGLYDMHGNVWEWCADWFAESYANEGKTDPMGPASGSFRVLRGGSRAKDPRSLRCAFRNGLPPDFSFGNVGFRVVVECK
jgi:formylglycine-generating enzyme required for sulfatase activity